MTDQTPMTTLPDDESVELIALFRNKAGSYFAHIEKFIKNVEDNGLME